MGIRLVDDVGAPLAVVGVDLLVESTAPEWNEWASYIVTALGYGSQYFRWGGGDFLKNMGIASMPWAAKNIYNRVRGISSPVSRGLGVKRVARWPAPLVEQPFGGARLV